MYIKMHHVFIADNTAILIEKKKHLLLHICSVLWKIYLLIYQYAQKQLTINLNFITSICIQCIITNTRNEDEAYNKENLLYYWIRYAFWTSTDKPMRFHTLWTIWCYENAKNVQFENKFSEPTLALETVSLMRCTNNTSRSRPFGHVTCRNCVFEIRSSTRKITENDCRTC